MILRRIALEQWRCFEREREIELLPGLNVIHGANEAGKSTILEALARAFYEKHKSNNAEIGAMQPLGRSVAPKVTVDFDIDGTFYRIEKRFVKRQMSELSRLEGGDWRVLADGEEADHGVRDLVHGGERGGANKMPMEARGLAQALWLLQRDPGDLPKDWAPQVRQSLGGIVEHAAETPEAGRFGAALEKQYLEWFTPKGAEKTGGPLANAREAERLAMEELRVLQDREEAVRDLRDRLEIQEASVRIIEDEATRHDSTVELKLKGTADAEAYERAHSSALKELEQAKVASHALEKTLDGLRARQEKAASLRGELAKIEREVRHAEADAREQSGLREEAQAEVDRLRGRVQALRRRRDALDAALRRRTKLDQAEGLERVLVEITNLRKAVEEKQVQLTALAAPDAETKAAFDRADHDLATALSVRRASGIVVRFALENGADVVETHPSVSAGVDGLYFLTRETTFDLGSLGSITVGGGGEGVAKLDARIAKHEEERATLLGGLSSEDFLRLHLAGEEIRVRLRTDAADLANWEKKHPRLESEIPALRADAAEVLARISILEDGWETLGSSTLETLRKTATADLEGTETELDSAEKRERSASTKVTELTERAGLAKNRLIRQQTGIDHEDREAADVIRTYGNQDALITAAAESARRLHDCEAVVSEHEELHWARVEAPRLEAQQALDKQKSLRDRAVEAGRVARELRAALRQEIKDGFHERLSEAEERLQGLCRQRELAERRGRGLRLLRDLYRKRKEEQGQTLRSPVAKLVVPWLRHVTDGRYESVEMDERLMPVGLHGKRHEGVLPLDSLSHGTREQTVLLVRLALARLVADERPFPVVLDDRLVNADRVRMDKMGLILRQIADRGQLVVATCDPTRYDGLGANMVQV